MINQMWSDALFKRYDEWDKGFHAWAKQQPNGLVDPVEWMRANGLPSSNPAIAEAYKAMQTENRRRLPLLREQYEQINPCPVRRFKK